MDDGGAAKLQRDFGLRTCLASVLGERVDRRLTAICLALAFGLLALVGLRWWSYHYDFHMFRGSAREYLEGSSPYRGFGLSFFHPPLTLHVYRPFAYVPEPWATRSWYALKLLALYGLFRVWSRDFERLSLHWTTILYFVFAYNAALYEDLVTGNVSIFEELLVWSAFGHLLRGRYALFAALVVFAAQFKVTPVFFAVLPPCVLPRRPVHGSAVDVAEHGARARRAWGWSVATFTGFFAVFGLNHVLEPELFEKFWWACGLLDERGSVCPSTLAMFRDVLDALGGAGFSRRTRLDEGAFILSALSILGVSARTLHRYRRSTAAFDPRLVVYFACFAFVLVSPRMKNYTYILLLVPTLALLRADWRRAVVPTSAMILPLALWPAQTSLLPFRAALVLLLREYIVLVTAFVVWCAYASWMWKLSERLPTGDAPRTPSVDAADRRSWERTWVDA